MTNEEKKNVELAEQNGGVDLVELYEQMLFQRSARGIRPMLYVSSYVDLECSMVMLLNDEEDDDTREMQQPSYRGVGYHVVMN
jgi:hypothetical protein